MPIETQEQPREKPSDLQQKRAEGKAYNEVYDSNGKPGNRGQGESRSGNPPADGNGKPGEKAGDGRPGDDRSGGKPGQRGSDGVSDIPPQDTKNRNDNPERDSHNQNPGGKSGDKPGDKPGDNPGDNPGEKPQTPSPPGQTPRSGEGNATQTHLIFNTTGLYG